MKKDNTKKFNCFHVLNIFKNVPHLKEFHGCFLTHMKAAQFVLSLIVFVKLKVFDRLKIHRRKILRGPDKACEVQVNSHIFDPKWESDSVPCKTVRTG